MKADADVVVLIVTVGMVVAVFLASVTFYQVRELDYRRIAIEHGCMVNSNGVICPQGDRK